MSDKILQVYDGARRGDHNTCWSYSVWKLRMALNYKDVAYTTVWVDHDTARPTLQALGIPPNTDGGFEYTVPTVVFPDGTVMRDSAVIAARVEEIHPTPSIHIDADLQAEADRVVHQTMMPLFPVYMPLVARNVIPESTIPTFAASRHKRFGISLEEMERTRGGEQAWTAAAPGFAALKALLTDRKKDDGPFILGGQVCFADFMLVALFEALRRVDRDMFERAVGVDPAFRGLHDAAKVWMQRDT